MNMNVRVWVKVFTREEFEQYLKEEFDNTMKMFENFLKPIQIQNLSAYLEMKKMFQTMYDSNVHGLLELYDKTKSPIITE